MDNEDDAHLFHGLIQLKNKSNTNESVLDTTEDEEDEKEKYSIFAEPKSKKVISLDQIHYLKQRKNDTQVWHYLGRALYQLSFEMYPSLNRMNINHPQPISEPFGIEPVNEEAINTLKCTYVLVYTAMSCQYKAKAVIDSSANPNSPDFVKLRREKRFSDLESHISTLLVFLNHFKQPCPGFSQILVHENTMLVELQKSLFLGLKELDKDPKTTTNGIYTKDIHDALHWICDNIYLASDKHVDNSFSSMVDDL
ncbi:hypothetical protein AX774_g3220 [Zancudomyces culisetae]|uniref:Uncharacterized protein n=1 Tax=Zancudomyces culisetae TaxID=1213189 RepID=A0A1R1PQU1_ZANCU|nr:hypothetical protein AX774_g3220 [Zancudomyces culisetae]|eukprot:OMH83273.1 hypothetical protein AX774_g3220 [Zancudomyces culisetae]